MIVVWCAFLVFALGAYTLLNTLEFYMPEEVVYYVAEIPGTNGRVSSQEKSVREAVTSALNEYFNENLDGDMPDEITFGRAVEKTVADYALGGVDVQLLLERVESQAMCDAPMDWEALPRYQKLDKGWGYPEEWNKETSVLQRKIEGLVEEFLKGVGDSFFVIADEQTRAIKIIDSEDGSFFWEWDD
jgi:hypothetical protein